MSDAGKNGELLQDMASEDSREDTVDSVDSLSGDENISSLRRWNWPNIATIFCLWVTSCVVWSTYSVISPFFPQEVNKYNFI